jgi:hypothetical protein
MARHTKNKVICEGQDPMAKFRKNKAIHKFEISHSHYKHLEVRFMAYSKCIAETCLRHTSHSSTAASELFRSIEAPELPKKTGKMSKMRLEKSPELTETCPIKSYWP